MTLKHGAKYGVKKMHCNHRNKLHFKTKQKTVISNCNNSSVISDSSFTIKSM